jgi:hypothetical protein
VSVERDEIGRLPPTEKQIAYVRALQHHLRLPDRMLDDHAVKTFGAPFAGLSRGQVSTLIDTLVGWEGIPADLQRAAGQMDLL